MSTFANNEEPGKNSIILHLIRVYTVFKGKRYKEEYDPFLKL